MKNTKTIISGAISSSSKSEQLLINLCISIAEAYLRTKSKQHAFLFSLVGTSLRDFAIDCIAELFEKRESRLIVFEKWISSSELENLSDSELFIKIRRLVFRKVNDHVFESYKDFDPSLSKIIRNLKRGVKAGIVEGLALNRSGKYIFLEEEASGKDVLEMNQELFVMKFSSKFKEISSMVDALQILRELFETLEEYPSKIHCVSFALIIREFYTALNEENDFYDNPLSSYTESESEYIISKRVEQLKREMYSTYVIKNKITESDFSGYFMVVKRILISLFNENESSGKSHFEHFSYIYGEVGKEEYRNHHRKFLEYFVKKAREDVIVYIKKENNSANRSFG